MMLNDGSMEDPNNTPGYIAVMRLAKERPDWLPIVEVCLEEAKQTQDNDFAGSWVLKKAKVKGITWFPNLRILVSYEILKREGVSRGGRRAYYSMPDINGVGKALKDLKLKG